MIFLNLHKAYDALDKDICLEILEGYGMGPRSFCILWTYWYWLQMFVRVGGYYGTEFQGFGGGDAGGLSVPHSPHKTPPQGGTLGTFRVAGYPRPYYGSHRGTHTHTPPPPPPPT